MVTKFLILKSGLVLSEIFGEEIISSEYILEMIRGNTHTGCSEQECEDLYRCNVLQFLDNQVKWFLK